MKPQRYQLNANVPERDAWQSMLTHQQQKILNAACGDLSAQVAWHGNRLSKDDWRHFIAGTVLGWRMLPGIPMGVGAPGFVMLGGSSMDLKKAQCIEAITLVFSIGDAPWDYEPTQKKRVMWCDAVCLARHITDSEWNAA